MSNGTKECHVVAIPHMGRGHINPLLSLCKTIAQKKPNIHISFVVTEEWVGLLGSSEPPPPPNLKYEPIPNVLPLERGRGANLEGFLETAFAKIPEPVEQLLDRIEPPVHLIIADLLLAWTVQVGKRRNIPVASFWPMSASMFSLLYHFDHLLDAKFQGPNEDQQIDSVSGVSSIHIADLPFGLFQEHKSKLSQLGLLQGISMAKDTHCVLFRTIPELEGPAIDALKLILSPVPTYIVGPCIKPFLSSPHHHQLQPSYMTWLDSHPKRSVLYVSLGTVMPVSSSQVEELMAGLRDSGVPFMWVSREDTLRVEGGGGDKECVVPWCDQMRVLGHGSVGGFMSHCGWNSTLEGVIMGVPMITFPLVFDQKANSKLVVEDWGVGWRCRGEVTTDGLIRREVIAGVVKRFMDLECDERKGLESKCREVKEMAIKVIGRGGSIDVGLDEFITSILTM